MNQAITQAQKELLSIRREMIRNNTEYYWDWQPSKKRDYIAYKKQLLNN